MSQMIERVARALYEQEHASEKWDENYAKYFAWDGPNFKGQDYFRRIARTAIEAMLEPTDEMCKAAGVTQWSAGTYREMIRAALSRSP